MERDEGHLLEMTITGVEVGTTRNGCQRIKLETSRGSVGCRYYSASGSRQGVICVGGIGGDFDTPAKELYPRLCRQLAQEGVSSLRVRFRHSTELEESVLDVLAGLTYLEGEGIDTIALVGHSFGGAVAVQAAALDEDVRTVVTLATQSHGVAPVAGLAPRCSILLIHGTMDETLPAVSSEYTYDLAKEPKKLILLEGARHGLDEAADEVYRVVHDWIVDNLGEAARKSAEGVGVYGFERG